MKSLSLSNGLIRALLVALTLALGACGTPPQKSDPRDPEIFRPASPVYPMPER
ncbi:MAG: hypothetical protein HZA93_13090 [Verrucomicrobia bacterium]|nr:hypothetical protein [Verrucomicrobiota bacterium]